MFCGQACSKWLRTLLIAKRGDQSGSRLEGAQVRSRASTAAFAWKPPHASLIARGSDRSGGGGGQAGRKPGASKRARRKPAHRNQFVGGVAFDGDVPSSEPPPLLIQPTPNFFCIQTRCTENPAPRTCQSPCSGSASKLSQTVATKIAFSLQPIYTQEKAFLTMRRKSELFRFLTIKLLFSLN